MPYSGPNDSSLPSNVLRLSPTRRRQWLHVYESEKARGASDGEAIRRANGVIMRQMGHSMAQRDFHLPDGFVPLAGSSPVVTGGGRSLLNRIADFLGFGGEGGEGNSGNDGSPSTDFNLREMPDGRLRFFTFATNNYVDRGNLIFPTAAQRDYESWVERTGIYPELWLWHARGSSLGQVDKIWFDGHVQVSSGLINDGKEELAFELASRDDLGMSHGYIGRHVNRPDGTVEVVQFREFEQSILPHEAAANLGTYFGVFGQREGKGDMARFTQAQRDWLRDVGRASPEEIDNMESLTTQMQDRFREYGIDWRSLDMDEGATPAAQSGTPAASGAAQPGGAGTPPADGSAAPGALTEDDVRRIVAETVNPINAGIESLTGSVRSLTEQVQQNLDSVVANQYNARVNALPQGFRASVQGAAPDDAAVAAAGARAKDDTPSFLDKAFGAHPLLGGGRQNGGQ